MRHQIAGRKLGRTTSHRWAMLRNLLTSFFEHERVKTTDAKAKELRPLAEKIIQWGKRGDLHARRQMLAIIRSRKVVGKVFDSIAPRYQNRVGGYVRILKLGVRRGDGAPVSIVELVTEGKESRITQKQRREKRLPKSQEAQRANPLPPAGPAEEKA